MREAGYELAYHLIDRGARVFIIELPQGPEKGLDDYLCQYSIEEFKTLPKREVRKETVTEMIVEATLETLPEILKRLANLKETERAIHINSLSEKLKIPKQSIKKDLQSLCTKKQEIPNIDRLLESGVTLNPIFQHKILLMEFFLLGQSWGKKKFLFNQMVKLFLPMGAAGIPFGLRDRH